MFNIMSLSFHGYKTDIKIRSVLTVWDSRSKHLYSKPFQKLDCGHPKKKVICVYPTQIPCLTWWWEIAGLEKGNVSSSGTKNQINQDL